MGQYGSLNEQVLLSFQNCRFKNWTEVAIEAPAGNLVVLDSAFLSDGIHIRLGKDIHRARILSNRFPKLPRIENETLPGADVQISHRAIEFERLDPTPHVPAPMPRPPTNRLALVTDFGAHPDAPDNTEMFQKALDYIGKAGGGTVYVPAGLYWFEGELLVPSGVELRGSFDVPHHTKSRGSVLMPTANAGDTDATPFIRLERSAGLRGIQVWYPHQDPANIMPYPWTVQGLGPDVWLVDVTLGNAYRGVDLWSYPSDGHIVRFLAGTMFDRGLWVSKNDGEGWVEDLHINPHYSVLQHHSLPRPPWPRYPPWAPIISQMRRELEGLVFGRSARQHVRGTFIYAAYDAIAFRYDEGGTNARVFMHGTDTGSRAAVIEYVGPQGVDFINTMLVPLGAYVEAAIITTESFQQGQVRFFNSQVWAGPLTGRFLGSGDVLIQQIHPLSGGIEVLGGRFRIENANFARDLTPHIFIGPDIREARVLACLSFLPLVPFRLDNRAGARTRAVANAGISLLALPDWAKYPKGPPAKFKFDFEEPAAVYVNRVTDRGGGIHNIYEATCKVVRTKNAPSPTQTLQISGRVDVDHMHDHAFVYFRLADGPFVIWPDTVLTYWIQPLNWPGQFIGIDLLFSDGSVLRDLSVPEAHPAAYRGKIGQWSHIHLQIGPKASGKTVTYLMAAFDRHPGIGPFAALIDDVRLESHLAIIGRRTVTMTPDGGRIIAGTKVTLATCSGADQIRYTLDGTHPGENSPVYERPIVLDRPGLWEIRAAVVVDGTISPLVVAQLFDVHAAKE